MPYKFTREAADISVMPLEHVPIMLRRAKRTGRLDILAREWVRQKH